MYLPPPFKLDFSVSAERTGQQLVQVYTSQPSKEQAYKSFSDTNMSCSSPRNDLIKIEDPSSDAQFSTEKTKNDQLMSCFEKVTINEHQRNGLRLKNDMSQTICLFRKYLLTKNQQSIGKTNMEESQFIKRRSPPGRPLIPPKSGCNLTRFPSFLEQELLPGMRRDATQSISSDDRSEATQLTIFYAGAVNVYDNVTVDKAQAIMLLAGESSLSKPVITEMPKSERRTSLHQSNLPSACKLEAADLPIARSHSLLRFLEKRRERMLNKSPYAPSSSKHKDREQTTDDHGIKEKHSIALSPFPSRLGYFFPAVSANKGLQGERI